MKYVDEYRGEADAHKLVQAIAAKVTRPWTLMEICGGQTHTLIKAGVDRLLPDQVTLVHGPGCPVCVTPISLIDKAIALAAMPEVILTSFGDMLRVPGSESDLLAAKAAGGDVRMVYSPLDAVTLAEAHPDREVVFFAVGFETTAPANAMAVWQRCRTGSAQLLHPLLARPGAAGDGSAILSAPDNLRAGVSGRGSRLHRDGLLGVRADRGALPDPDRGHRLRAAGSPAGDLHDDLRARGGALGGRESVQPLGHPRRATAKRRHCSIASSRSATVPWRGIGAIPASGYVLREEFARFDAERRFDIAAIDRRGVA